MSGHSSGSEYPYSSADYTSVPPSLYNSDAHSVTSSTASWGVPSSSSEYSSGSSQSNYTHSSGFWAPYGNEHRMPDEYSDTPAPSEYTTASSFTRAMIHSPTTVLPSRQMLHCEFQPWTGCQYRFQLDEAELWIRHTEDDHLRRNYPALCICWYCDDFQYDTQQSLDAGYNFESRMKHIADHMLYDGCLFENRRPDFHFLDHVYRLQLISPKAYQQAKGLSEGPPPPTEVFPLGWRPESSGRDAVVEVVDNSRRRRHRGSRRHY
ncbi:uncharacterized protein CTRU02_203702 [Colletotrichum truncatum]|uniref:Uncharacterized protein n=1 Tax=Colletotrichum truncatum TaxID=5467 RepID=A0ACC3ZA37_COLTU|nr:uncharacterized protein CTRU02_04036 [Colletotrichum truncatum]KAF6796076.1 hypothetical protein CTRU02_04036 [Colletotrichum truncatum]